MRSTFIRSITALALVIAMAVGMTASLSGKTHAASQITVTWKGNGGKNSQGQTQHYTYYYNKSSVTLKPSSTLYTRSGYTLSGFSVNGKTYSVGTSFTITSNTTITCIWKAKSRITVTYNTNYAQRVSGATTQSDYAGESFKLTPPTLSNNDLTFKEWNTKKDGTGTKYKANQTVKFSSNITLYPVWNTTITYKANGGSISGDTVQTIIVGASTKLSAPTPTRAGYTFLGYDKNSKATKGKYSNGSVDTFSSKTTLYAIWELTPSPSLVLPKQYVRLSNANSFVPIVESDGTTYGAAQGKFADVAAKMDTINKNPYSYNGEYSSFRYDAPTISRIQQGYGCGLYAALNTVAYVFNCAKTHDDFGELLLFTCAKNNDGFSINDILLDCVSGGEAPTLLAKIVNCYFELYGLDSKYLCTYKNCSSKATVEKDILSMLNRNYPVVLSYYSTSSGLLEYVFERESSLGTVLKNALNDKGEKRSINDHYFVVTGAYLNTDGSIRWLEISTWGEHQYIFWDHYWNNKSGIPLTNSYLFFDWK